MSFFIEVNNRKIEAQKGETILNALNRNGIRVPTLCYMKDFTPTGACRICVVELEGNENLIPACSHPVIEGMVIRTHSQRVIKARKAIVELLLANHPDDCLYCSRNGNCELQKLAMELNIRERKFPKKKKHFKLDMSSPAIVKDDSKCILCGRCIRICEEKQGVSAIDFINKGNEITIGPAYNRDLNFSSCINCGQCIMVCPTGALYEKENINELLDVLNNKEKHVIVQIAPSVSVSLAEEFDLKQGKDYSALLNAVLTKVGFQGIFDTAFGADLVIMEEATELYDRLKEQQNLPMFSSCCPAWIKCIEQKKSELLNHISSCKSPQQMLGALIKSYYSKKLKVLPENIYSVTIMPCTAKKFEAQREEMTNRGISDIDLVLTTRELAKLIRLLGIDITVIDDEPLDVVSNKRSSSGKMLGTSAGLTEGIIRTLHFLISGKELETIKIQNLRTFKGYKEFFIKIGKYDLGFIAISDLLIAKKVIDEVIKGRKDIHFIEIMACEGGCVGGGGQFIGTDVETLKARIKGLYLVDEKESLRFAHKNPDIIALYNEYLERPLSDKCLKIIHTSYSKRDVMI